MRTSLVAAGALAVLQLSCGQREIKPAADANRVIAGMQRAIRDSTALRYDFTVTPTGDERNNVRAAGGTAVIGAQGAVRIDGWRDPLPAEKGVRERFVLVSDRATVTLRSDTKKTLSFAPMHRAGGLVLNARAGRVVAPFANAQRMAGFHFRVAGVEKLDNVVCDLLTADSDDGKQQVQLAVAREDHLPRRLSGGSVDLRVMNPKLLDGIDAKTLVVDAPPSYARRELTLGGPAAGEPAPAWTLQSSAGPISLASLRGKVVILDFWATWCGPCRASIPVVKRLYDTYHAQGLDVVGATWHERGDPEAFAKELGLRYPHADGNAIGAAYGVDYYGIPTMYVIDRDGTVADFFVGWGGDETARKLESDVTTLLRRP